MAHVEFLEKMKIPANECEEEKQGSSHMDARKQLLGALVGREPERAPYSPAEGNEGEGDKEEDQPEEEGRQGELHEQHFVDDREW